MFFFTEILRSQGFGCESQILHFSAASRIRFIQSLNANVMFHDCLLHKANKKKILSIQQWSKNVPCQRKDTKRHLKIRRKGSTDKKGSSFHLYTLKLSKEC